MPFDRPTLSALRAQAQQDVLSDPAIGPALLRNANTRVLARLFADFAHLHYGFLDWISRESVPFTCTDEFLEAWAGLKGVTRKAATPAVLAATFTNSTPGATIPANNLVIRADGIEYITLADAIVGGGGTVVTNIQAQETGSAGNSDNGIAAALGAAIAGIQGVGSITGTVTAGTDVETDAELRSRMLEAYANPPQGGDAQDYVTWALAVPGVTRAWPLPLSQGAGTVSVYFMMDEAEAAHGGFPQGTDGVATNETRDVAATGDQLTLANYIYPLRPVTALVYAVAPVANPIAFRITGVAVGLQPEVEAAIDDLFLQKGTPGGVLLPDGSTGGKVELKDLWAAVTAVAGIGDFDIVTPAADIVSASGLLPTRGAMTWV
jgi:uncharacterized phage protein gp47/JayE